MTFDLRECELTEQKQMKKKLSRGFKSSATKRIGKSINRHSSTTPISNLSTSNNAAINSLLLRGSIAGGLSTSNNINSLLLRGSIGGVGIVADKPVFQIDNVDDMTEQNYLRSSNSSNLSTVKRFSQTDGLINTAYSPLDSSSNNLSQSQSFFLQKQKSINSNSYDSNSSVMQINSARRVSGILRKKSRMIRNMARLLPATVSAAAANASTNNCAASMSNLADKRQV